MRLATQRATAFVVAAATVGFTSLIMATPAVAAPIVCANGATLIGTNTCELRFTAPGAHSFTPTAEMSQLEALLVAGGGSGTGPQGTYGAGGGGEVTLVGFSDSTTPVDIAVGDAGVSSTVSQAGTSVGYARAGGPGQEYRVGGTSGSMNLGWTTPVGSEVGAGGGAAASPVDAITGGAGVIVDSIAPAGSPFSGVLDCYGGGGAGYDLANYGTATCGGGFISNGTTGLVTQQAVPNSGGGAATGSETGASGIVIVRWLVLDVTVSFDAAGRGGAIAPQTFPAGGTPTQPADPTARGYVFEGWFTDAALTVPADFSISILADTTLYASWRAVPSVVTPALPEGTLPVTGADITPAAAPIGIAALLLGAGLLALKARRQRQSL